MRHLIVYLKAPVAGTVKTRLQTRYTSEQAAQLYRAFILDTLETAASVDVDRYVASYAGDRDVVRAIVPSAWELCEQIDTDLGDRMLASLRGAIEKGAEKAVLIGTDIPSLSASHIEAAYEALDDSDVVLGPTTDGGFYLIGTTQKLPDIFPDVAWSSDRVYEQTVEGIRAAELRLTSVPAWRDIDTPEDLDRVLLDRDAALSHTRAAASAIHP